MTARFQTSGPFASWLCAAIQSNIKIVTMPVLTCHVCGRTVLASRMSAELHVVRENGDIVGVGRNFVGFCEEHGPTMRQLTGSHGTLQEAVWSKRLNDAQRDRIYSRIEGDELRRFKLARRGKLWPTDDENERWLAMAGPSGTDDPSAIADKAP